MSEELLLTDRRGNLIQGGSLDQFFFIGAKNLSPDGIRTTVLPIETALRITYLYAATDFILATSFTSEQ